MATGRKKYTIVGNWKMNPDTVEEARKIFSSVARARAKYPKVNVVIAPPAPFISMISGKRVGISAQDVEAEPRGAFTGGISARQAKSAGADYAIIGHSERRLEGDSDEIVAQKTVQALSAGLRVILCVGERARDNHAHYLHEVREQITAVFSNLPDKKGVQWITIAYEPSWAIGKSYDTALKPADIHEMAIYIKKVVSDILGKKIALKVPVLYGGSLNSENAESILREGSIDGLLIGRQSLEPAFNEIIKYANSLS